MKRIVVYVSPQVEPLASRLIEKALIEDPPVAVAESERLAFHHRSADVPSRPVEGASLVVATPAALKRAKAIYEGIEVDVEEVQPDGLAPSDLPEDFPARGKLRRDGRFALAHQLLAASAEDLDSVSGVGEATIEDIDEALAEMNAERDPEADAANLAPKVDQDDSSNPEEE